MKSLPAFIFLFTVFFAVHSMGNGLESLNQCLDGLKNTHRLYHNYMPYWFFSLDPKLKSMTLGIRYLEENARVLNAMHGRNPPEKGNRYLIANSVVGCERYRKVFELRAWFLLFLFISGTCGVIFLTLRIFLEIIPEKSSKISELRKKNQPSTI